MSLSGVWILVGYGSLLAVCRVFVIADDDDWIDPYNMLNYDATSKSMKKHDEASSYMNVPTKRRAFNPSDGQMEQCPDITQCTNKLYSLQRELQELKRNTFLSPQQTCNPVFKRFLSKLLKGIEGLGLPTDVNADMHYDAEVKLSKQMVVEIQRLLNDDGTWRTGALDDALSQTLINFKLHDYEAWKWHFEDTFGVELETVIKVMFCILIIVLIICTETWSIVSWFVQFKRMFAICFFISLVWNWFYLYKIEFAKHQANIIKMENVNEKCTGLKKFDWKDNLKEWFRISFTLQDDPCNQYYELLVVNPIFLVSPTKAFTMTITKLITDNLKHLGQGISEFLKALLKDLPFTLQIPVLITVMLCVLVFIYSSAQAAVQQAVLRPLRGGRGDPPPPAVQQRPRPPLNEPEEEEDRDRWARGDADHVSQPRLFPGQEGVGIQGGNGRPDVRQRRHARPKEERQRVYVETLRNADNLYSEDEPDILRAAESSQHNENEPLTSDVAKEENETHTQMEPEQSKPASEGPSTESDVAINKASGPLDETTSVGPSKEEENVETIGSPIREMVQ